MSQIYNWYVVQVRSGYEKRCVLAIKQSLVMHGMDNLVESIVIPSESIEEIRKGKKVAVEKKFFPGYVLIKAVMSTELWHAITKVENTIKFLGASNKPAPLSDEEIERIFNQMKEGTNINSKIIFNIGDNVKVLSGPFESFSGVVEEIDAFKERLKVLVTIFGRATPVDLEFNNVSKEPISSLKRE